MILEINKELLLEAKDYSNLGNNIGSFVWNDNIKKQLRPSQIWQVQHAAAHNKHLLKNIRFNPRKGEIHPEDINKFNNFLNTYK